MNRTDVEFNAEGTILRGWLYRPDGDGPVPGVVMAHGFSAVKEMYLDAFAEVFADAGLAALVFDNRNFGASDGEPRQEIDPFAQVRDYRHAITYLQTMAGIDRERIGVWGTSYSGGHAIVLGAIDKRIKAVVAQVPLVSGFKNIQRLVRSDFLPGLRAALDADREGRFAGKEPGMIPVVAEDPLAPSALPTPDSWTWFTETGNTRAPSWRNEVTVRSVDMLMEYEPGAYIDRVSPTPFLLVVAAGDVLTPTDLAIEAYGQAREPKKLVILPGGHFDAYTGPDFELSSGGARDWLVQHLIG
jgi:fermentation-respiration switch protein FrsA (DUF1100 family)